MLILYYVFIKNFYIIDGGKFLYSIFSREGGLFKIKFFVIFLVFWKVFL